MDGFYNMAFINQGDTRILPWQGESRVEYARKYSQELRHEGYTYDEAAEVLKGPSYSRRFYPELTDDEIKDITGQVFAATLVFKDLDRNKKVLELVKKFKKKGYDDAEILRRIKIFNSRRCTPPIPDEELKRIQRDMTYTVETQNYWQTDREPRPDGKIVICMGGTVDLTKERG